MKKTYKSDFFNEYTPSSHPRHGTDARTTYIRMLMRGYIRERSLIEQIKTCLSDHNSSENLTSLNNEYFQIVDDMKLCFKRLLSRQEYDNKERYLKKDRNLLLTEKVQILMKENKALTSRLDKINSEITENQKIYHNN